MIGVGHVDRAVLIEIYAEGHADVLARADAGDKRRVVRSVVDGAAVRDDLSAENIRVDGVVVLRLDAEESADTEVVLRLRSGVVGCLFGGGKVAVGANQLPADRRCAEPVEAEVVASAVDRRRAGENGDLSGDRRIRNTDGRDVLTELAFVGAVEGAGGDGQPSRCRVVHDDLDSADRGLALKARAHDVLDGHGGPGSDVDLRRLGCA